MAIVINGSGTVTGISVGGLPDGIVDAGTLATNSVDSAELIDGAIDTSHFASGAGGITEVDKWYLTTDLAVTTDTALTTNLSRVTKDSWTTLGTGVSESSGIFSFPSTGYWQIVLASSWYKASGDSRYLASRIYTTTDNSTYVKGKEDYTSMYDGGGTYATSQADYIFEVTNTSNDKVKFEFYAIDGATLSGSATSDSTVLTFLKLGDL